VVAALFLEAADWLPPLIDLFEVLGVFVVVALLCVVDGRLCVVAGLLCVVAGRLWVVDGRLYEADERLAPPPPPEGRLIPPPPPMRCASIVTGNSIVAAYRSMPVMICLEVILVFII
jgi:hypothetical protein